MADWPRAAEPLEKLLNQVEMLRAQIDSAKNARLLDSQQARTEQRMREMLAGRIK